MHQIYSITRSLVDREKACSENMFSLSHWRAYQPGFFRTCPDPALLNKFINIWLIQNVIIKSGDHTKVGRTARNIYTEFNTVLANWCEKDVIQYREHIALHTGMYNQLHWGKKKSGLKIELCWCQSFRKRPTGYGALQEQHESQMSCCCEKCRYYTDKWSFCSSQMSISLIFGSPSRTFRNYWRDSREV